MEDQENIPLFVQDYLNKMDYDGYADFVKLSREYHKEREEYPGKHAVQSAHLNDFNRRTGNNRQLDYDDGLKRMDAEYRKQAFKIAQKNGYKGPDPTQPSDKEFTKQGEKFQGMIDHARQRQSRQTEQKQEANPDNEARNIEKLKEQQSYRQHTPKVEFKSMEEQSSNAEQANREQQRQEFLEQIKKTREQQTQRQQDKQTEI